MKKILTITLAVTVLSALTLSGPAQAHQRTASTSLSIRVSDDHPDRGDKVEFSGALKSNWKRCEAYKKVSLKRGKTTVQTKKTNQAGQYSFTQRINGSSNWRVRFKGRRWGVHPHRHRCLPSTSKTIEIRF